MNKAIQALALALPILLITGCETLGEREGEEAVVEERGAEAGAPAGEEGAAATARGAREGAAFQGHPLDDPASLLSRRTVYFEFDSSLVKDEDRPILEAHATYLAGHPSAAIVLEGHADERGSREYNVALGERRAKAVRQLMLIQGAGADQIKLVSYGEERPAAEGHSEESWRLNRRVEIVYRSR